MLQFVLEIKNRFFLLMLTWVSIFVVSYFYKEVLLFLVIQSHSFSSQVVLCTPSLYFILTDVTEIFSVYLRLSLFFSSQIVYLFLIYHSFSFFASATFKSEYLYLTTTLRVIFYFWILSVVLINLFLIPLTWDFFSSFFSLTSAVVIDLHFEARLSEYVSFYINTYHVCISYLQIFVVFLFSKSKFTKSYIIKFRKIYYYVFILLSTLLSPPDVLSQVLISFFMICIFEIFLLVTFFRKFI